LENELRNKSVAKLINDPRKFWRGDCSAFNQSEKVIYLSPRKEFIKDLRQKKIVLILRCSLRFAENLKPAI
jgi:hypothetical protein